MLQSMRSRRVGHDLVTEQQQASLFPTSLLSFLPSSHPYIRIPILQTVIHPSRYLPSSPSYPIYPSTLLSIYSPYNFLSIFLLIYSSIHPSIPRVLFSQAISLLLKYHFLKLLWYCVLKADLFPPKSRLQQTRAVFQTLPPVGKHSHQ